MALSRSAAAVIRLQVIASLLRRHFAVDLLNRRTSRVPVSKFNLRYAPAAGKKPDRRRPSRNAESDRLLLKWAAYFVASAPRPGGIEFRSG